MLEMVFKRILESNPTSATKLAPGDDSTGRRLIARVFLVCSIFVEVRTFWLRGDPSHIKHDTSVFYLHLMNWKYSWKEPT